ncbi:hypothetical protein K469DRAFT_15152 [Zopfia rhizophila CBS 207.26]|uniref:Uncharacterized protein n=1 Tax=Zopfia rhizophila CBS 207.26 TaxID=1314779 RepID=A0A6A6EXD8_9PEZI|nr:hypothetical protein K469DRAFT_15152 [Zopfia rhizophila CBS 207.26]
MIRINGEGRLALRSTKGGFGHQGSHFGCKAGGWCTVMYLIRFLVCTRDCCVYTPQPTPVHSYTRVIHLDGSRSCQSNHSLVTDWWGWPLALQHKGVITKIRVCTHERKRMRFAQLREDGAFRIRVPAIMVKIVLLIAFDNIQGASMYLVYSPPRSHSHSAINLIVLLCK